MHEFDLQSAVDHLVAADSVMKRVVEEHGPCQMKVDPLSDIFYSLFRSITYQQLSGKAAGTIFNRALDLFPDRTLTPERVLEMEDDALRGAGLSRAKVRAVNDLAAKRLDGTVPELSELVELPDDEVIRRITAVWGIGRWTVEMLLMFNLGRPDVLPSTDLGVQKGFQIAYGLDEIPKPRELEEHTALWRPYRSVASWYMWRVVEGPNDDW